ncbi:MAG: hypothetical protein LBJ31_04945, partial [Treponema sp.]|nr:hypothetical protein [Treponema sp.]
MIKIKTLLPAGKTTITFDYKVSLDYDFGYVVCTAKGLEFTYTFEAGKSYTVIAHSIREGKGHDFGVAILDYELK